MKQKKTELMQMIDTACKNQRQIWERPSFKIFKRTLVEFIGVSYDKIQLKEVLNVREANQFIKFRELESAYILLVLKNQNYRMALIDIETKKKLADLNYYGRDKVSVRQEIENENATCYVIYSGDIQNKKQLKELRRHRLENKKDSYLDKNSIYYRHKYEYRERMDKAGFKNKMINLHVKIAQKFLKHDVNYLIDKITKKEQKLYNLYQSTRNEIFRDTNKTIKMYRLHTPSAFYEELEQMRDALIRLQNIEIKVNQYLIEHPDLNNQECRNNYINECEKDIVRNYIYIIEKESSFKEALRDFVVLNSKEK